ncbi:MAG: hypothetical protein P8020_21675, partial [Acidobacteriota bacterium]
MTWSTDLGIIDANPDADEDEEVGILASGEFLYKKAGLFASELYLGSFDYKGENPYAQYQHPFDGHESDRNPSYIGLWPRLAAWVADTPERRIVTRLWDPQCSCNGEVYDLSA